MAFIIHMIHFETPRWSLAEWHDNEVEEDEGISNQIETIPLLLSQVVSWVVILFDVSHLLDLIIESNFKLQLSYCSFHFLAFNLVDGLSCTSQCSGHRFIVTSAHWPWRVPIVSFIRHIKINYYYNKDISTI